MTTYKDAGVDISLGGAASQKAYAHAISTFTGRKGCIGVPLMEEGGFAGLLDMGDYYLVQGDDGTGTKMEIACVLGKYDTLGADLLAMVADDAVCTGAEVISVSNTLDVPSVDPEMVDMLMKGLAEAAKNQKIVIPGGEIAEVPDAVSSPVWNATAVGIVAKDRVLQPQNIKPGDSVLSLRSRVARSNGFSLIRKILIDAHGKDWHSKEWKDGVSWGEVTLTPSVIYSAALLKLLGRYGEDRLVEIKGLAHITGGGISENLARILKKSGYGADLDNLWNPHEAIIELIKLGSVPIDEAYRTWNMGNGMLAVVSPEDAEKSIALLKEEGIEVKIAGVITKETEISVTAFDGSTITA
jgi:phosphoribosylformylglycinamidine cyclo-ligase